MSDEPVADWQCLSITEASRWLGVCVRTVRREIERGRLKAIRVGRSLRISVGELRAYVQRQTIGASV